METKKAMINVSKAICTSDSIILVIDDAVLNTIEAYINNNGVDMDCLQLMTQDVGAYWGYDLDTFLDNTETWHYSKDTIEALNNAKDTLTSFYPGRSFRLMVLSIEEELIWNAEDDSSYTVAWRYLNHAVEFLNFLFTISTKEKN